MEETLSNYEVLGAEWAQGLKSESEKQSQDTASPIPCPVMAPLSMQLDLSKAVLSA